jgi:hypothetical protein
VGEKAELKITNVVGFACEKCKMTDVVGCVCEKRNSNFG